MSSPQQILCGYHIQITLLKHLRFAARLTCLFCSYLFKCDSLQLIQWNWFVLYFSFLLSFHFTWKTEGQSKTHRDLPSAGSLQNAYNSQRWARSRPGNQNQSGSSTWVAGSQVSEPSPVPPRMHDSRKLELEARLGLIPGTWIWDVGIRNVLLTMEPWEQMLSPCSLF